MLRKNAAQFGDKPALKYRKQGAFVTLSYAGLYQRALMVARGLKKIDVKRGDKVAILSENRAGWVIGDMGILCAGAVTVPVYPTSAPEQIEYMLNHSEAKAVLVSSKYQYSKLLEIRKSIPHVRLVVSFERFLGEPELPVCTFYQLSEIDHPVTETERKELETGIDSVGRQDPLTLIYTSGTTGVPKGVILTHFNVLFEAWAGRKMAEGLSCDEVLLSCLPLSHVLERAAGYYMTIMHGCLMAFADSIEKIPENMLEVKPTVMVGVPRLFEKIHSRILENVHQVSPVKRKLFHWAVGIGQRYVEAKYVQKRSSPLLALRYGLADRLVFSKLRRRFGGRMKLFVCGGAPLDRTINQFFWVIGLPILEGYGLTETSAAVCINSFERVRFGSVGTALGHTKIKTDADGEILIRGPQVMVGYHKDEQATRQVLQDGWLRTGDIGRVENGFVYITDRKKELIITAGGKNIAPQPIENQLKLDKYISQAFIHGDRKPYLTALLTPNLERILEYARERKIHYCDMDDLVVSEQITALIAQRIQQINGRLAQCETIKKFALLPRDFSIEGGELSPALKLRRKFICEKYKDKIERMYAEPGN